MPMTAAEYPRHPPARATHRLPAQSRPWHPARILPALALLVVPALALGLEVRLFFVGDAEGSALRGARQGLAEAQAQGEFLGQRYVLETADELPAGIGDLTAVIVDLPPERILEIARRVPAVPVLNAGSEDDELRAHCLPNLLHTRPSAAMRAAAVAQWQQAHPGAEVEARAWHPDFKRYAASQLNNRYREQFALAMDDPAWAGWAAVKLVSDTVAREQSGDPAVILAAVREKLAFDGQKGVDMSFRANGQLRQPLLLVADGELVGEAPVRGVSDDLDSLGGAVCANQ